MTNPPIPLATSVTTGAQQEVTETLTQPEQDHSTDRPPEQEQPPKPPKTPKTKVTDSELLHIAELMSPQYVEGILKYLFSEHPLLPSFLLWDIPDSASAFAVRVDRLIHSPTYVRRLQPALLQIFPDGFHHCSQVVAGAMVNFAIFDTLKKAKIR